MTCLEDRLAGYLAVGRALGYRLVRAEKLLGQFIAWMNERDEQTITTALGLAWATLPPAGPSAWHAYRLSVVRALDPAHELVPQDLLPQRPRRAVPYLYTDAEVKALMDASSGIPTPHRAATMCTLVGLLAVTGMRVGEAIRLNQSDIDDERGVLTVVESKFGKSRQLALGALIQTYGEVTSRKYIAIIAWFNLLSLFLNGCRVPLETFDKIAERTSPLG